MLAIVALVLAALLRAGAAQATVLTFDVSGGAVNFLPVPADYGAEVASTLPGGHAHAVGAEGFAPDVVVDFGASADPNSRRITGAASRRERRWFRRAPRP